MEEKSSGTLSLSLLRYWMSQFIGLSIPFWPITLGVYPMNLKSCFSLIIIHQRILEENHENQQKYFSTTKVRGLNMLTLADPPPLDEPTFWMVLEVSKWQWFGIFWLSSVLFLLTCMYDSREYQKSPYRDLQFSQCSSTDFDLWFCDSAFDKLNRAM